MTIQRILLHAVAVVTLGAMCMAQGSTHEPEIMGDPESTYPNPSYLQQWGSPDAQPGTVSRPEAAYQEGQQTRTSQYGQSGTTGPSSMSEPTAFTGASNFPEKTGARKEKPGAMNSPESRYPNPSYLQQPGSPDAQPGTVSRPGTKYPY